MRSSPSIVPADRLDRDTYLVLEDFARAPVAHGARRMRLTEGPAKSPIARAIPVPMEREPGMLSVFREGA